MTEKIRINYNPFTPFNLFKWAIYFLLMINVYVFFNEDYATSSVLFSNGFTAFNVIVAFATTIDTAAWVILILLFELETYILPDELIIGWTKWVMHVLRFVLYVIIVYSFYGYLSIYLGVDQFQVIDLVSLCPLVDGVNTFMTTQDEFDLITIANCGVFSDSPVLYQSGNEAIFSNVSSLTETRTLALVDVINSATWLLICLVLEIDVRLQIKNMLEGKKRLFSNFSKALLYTVLVICAVYWGITGKIIDFWDAFLWVLAFFSIELNIFQWHKEEASEQQV